MLVLKEKKYLVLISGVSAFLAWTLGAEQIIPMYEYAGMNHVNVVGNLQVTVSLGVLNLLIFLASDYRRPLGVAANIQIFISNVWFILFHSVSGITGWVIFLGGLTLALPPLFFVCLMKIKLSAPVIKKLPYVDRKIIKGAMLCSLLVFLIILAYLSYPLDLSIDNSYVRRGEFKTTPRLFGYVFYMTLNGALPLLAFYGALNGRPALVLVALLGSALGFAAAGLKLPLLYVSTFVFLGFYQRLSKRSIVSGLLLALLALLMVGVAELYIVGSSLIADLYVRRAIFVVAQLQSYYSDYVFGHPTSINGLLFGKDNALYITYEIGKLYLDNPSENANSSTYLVSLAQNGVCGLILNIIVVSLVFKIYDAFFKKTGDQVWLALTVLYSMLLIEQLYSTALVTSGVGLITMLYFFLGSYGTPTKRIFVDESNALS